MPTASSIWPPSCRSRRRRGRHVISGRCGVARTKPTPACARCRRCAGARVLALHPRRVRHPFRRAHFERRRTRPANRIPPRPQWRARDARLQARLGVQAHEAVGHEFVATMKFQGARSACWSRPARSTTGAQVAEDAPRRRWSTARRCGRVSPLLPQSPRRSPQGRLAARRRVLLSWTAAAVADLAGGLLVTGLRTDDAQGCDRPGRQTRSLCRPPWPRRARSPRRWALAPRPRPSWRPRRKKRPAAHRSRAPARHARRRARSGRQSPRCWCSSTRPRRSFEKSAAF